MGGNRSRARKWYRGDQDLEVKTESQSLMIESGKPGCINHLHRLGIYHLRKPVDHDEERIVARVLLIGKHRQSRLSRDSCEPANDDENQIITGALSICRYGYPSQIHR